jgi:hypothetical protein
MKRVKASLRMLTLEFLESRGELAHVRPRNRRSMLASARHETCAMGETVYLEDA